MDETWAKTLVLARLPETREIKLKRNHDRYPDIGLRIRVSMPYEDSPDVASMQYKDYIGEYCGHGQSKTAFILNGPSGDPFCGKILKVASHEDREPSVFTQMEMRCPDSALKMLYNAFGSDGAQVYYCWITDRTIPLDQLLDWKIPIHAETCTLAVLLCTARLALAGLRLSDCGFFNFGVLVDDADHHTVVCIDAGSYDLAEPGAIKKSTFNEQVAHKIWKKAKGYKVNIKRLQNLWWQQPLTDNCALKATITVLQTEWMKHPYVSIDKKVTLQLERDLNGEVLREKTNLMGSPAFKAIHAIASHFAGERNEEVGRECFAAAERTRRELDPNEWEYCQELHSRITMKNAPWAAKEIELIERTPEEFKEGMEEWRRLKEFRDSKFEPGRQIPEALAWKTLYHYIDQKCELEEEQNTNKRKRKILHAILHQKLLYKLAAVAILQVDMPMPGTQIDFHGEEPLGQRTPFGEVINPKVKYATEMGQWLICFARLVKTRREKDEYKSNLAATPQITGRKWWKASTRADADDGSTSWRHSRTWNSWTSQAWRSEDADDGRPWNSWTAQAWRSEDYQARW